MNPFRRARILEKVAFETPWSIRENVAKTVAGAKANYAAGGTTAQQQVNDDVATIPENLTLADRLKQWSTRQPMVGQPWANEWVAPIFNPPSSLGSPRADRGLQMLEKHKNTGFGPPKCENSIDCSTFASQVAETPRMTTDAIYQDARGQRKNWMEVPQRQLRAGDFLIYPGHKEDGKPEYGHIAMYAGGGRIIDASASGSGVRYRQPPPAFYERAEAAAAGNGPAPIVVRPRKDRDMAFTPVPPPGAGTPIVFKPGEYQQRRFLDTGTVAPAPTVAATPR